MRFFLLFLAISLLSFEIGAQPPVRTPHRPIQKKAEFQVRVRAYPTPDTISQVFIDPISGEAIRVISGSVGVMGSRGETSKTFRQLGLVRENGSRLSLPHGESFFAYKNGILYTERVRISLDKRHMISNIKKYSANKQKLILLDKARDTSSIFSPKSWFHLDKEIIRNSRAFNMGVNGDYALWAENTPHPLTFLLKRLHLPTGDTLLRKEVALAQSSHLFISRMQGFGLRQVHLTSDIAVMHSMFSPDTGEVAHIFSAFDLNGELLWEKKLGYFIMAEPHPYDELFILSQNPLTNQQLHCLDATTGAVKWKQPLYDLYTNDLIFDYRVADPEQLVVHDMKSIKNGEYLALIVGQINPGTGISDMNLLMLYNRLGKLVYRYHLKEPARFFKLRERNMEFGVVSEEHIYRFWGK
ncbi:MAG: hypothetical protein AAGI38_14565 [Bacteroidota bacterium]